MLLKMSSLNNEKHWLAAYRVMDLLRFQHFTGGQIWCKEYGCSDSPVDFKNLIKYSPLHNIRVPPSTNNNTEVIQYPGVFVMTADHDDRVVPSHSYKYVAQLQHTFRNESYQASIMGLVFVLSPAGMTFIFLMMFLIADKSVFIKSEQECWSF